MGQFVKGNVFLQGNFIETAVASNGSLGSGVLSPPGYHSLFLGLSPARLGITADPDQDGWSTGFPAFFGDYFLPGTPLEEWDIQINGFNARASRIDGDSAFTFGLEGYNTGYTATGNTRTAHWKGKMGDLLISQDISVDINKMYILFRVWLKNSGPVKLNKMYYNRSIDPDNEVEQSTWGHPTHMKIRHQLPDPQQRVAVTAIGDEYGTYFGMCSRDCRAKTYFLNSGLIVTAAIDSLHAAIGPAAGYYYSKTDSVYSDVGMGIVFSLGSLNPGDSTFLSYGYLLKAEDLNALMDAFAPSWLYNGQRYGNNDVINACEGDVINLGIVSNGYTDWRWGHSPLLADTMGVSNRVTVNGTKSYTVKRFYPASCGGGHDTLRITINASTPVKPVLSRSGNVLSIPAVYSVYNWCKDGVSIGAASLPDYTVSSNGRYHVRVTDAYGCLVISDTIVVDDLGSGITLNTGEHIVKLYPNPVRNKLFIDAPAELDATLSDASGKLLLQQKNAKVLDLEQLPDGIYLLRLYGSDGQLSGTQKIYKGR